jgi:hypothetical protein
MIFLFKGRDYRVNLEFGIIDNFGGGDYLGRGITA